MVQIVTTILPHLSGKARPESELKSSFVVMLGEVVAEVVWAVLRQSRDDVPGGGGTILAKLHELQTALDAANTDKERVAWSSIFQKFAHDIAIRVKAMIDKNPAEWQREGALPEGCDASDWLQIGEGGDGDDSDRVVAKAQWRVTFEATVERAVLRTLRRQPTQRVDIYDQFVGLWLDREIQKVMGQRGATSAPQLQLEVRGALFIFGYGGVMQLDKPLYPGI